MPCHTKLVLPSRNIVQYLPQFPTRSKKQHKLATFAQLHLLPVLEALFKLLSSDTLFTKMSCQIIWDSHDWKPQWLKDINFVKTEVTSQKTLVHPCKLAVTGISKPTTKLKSHTHLTHRSLLTHVKLLGVWTLSPRMLKAYISTVANIFGVSICI